MTDATADLDLSAAWAAAVSRHAGRRALVTRDGSWTYDELDAWSTHVASALRAVGVARATRVALVGANSAHYVAIVLAVSRLGAVLVPLDPTLTPSELLELVNRSGATTLVSDVSVVDLPDELGQTLRLVDMRQLVPGGPATHDSGAHLDLDWSEASGDDLWAIMYTSGSTSKPRGVMIPRRTFAVAGSAMSEALGYGAADTVGSVLPIHHASVTLMSWAPAVAVGASFALSSRFSRSGFWDFVRDTGTTVMTTVPTIVEILLTAPPIDGDRDHPLRMVVTHRSIAEFGQRFDVEMRSIWAMTETGGLGCVQRAGDAAGGVGRPYPDDAVLRLVGPDGSEVADGEPGELVFRHRAVMSGYLGEPPPTSGWIASGDLGVRQHDDTIAYVGRSKNMIKRGGENVSLEELERVLFEHPAVDEVVVVPVPDPIYVEEACAVVVWSDDREQLAELRAYCREVLAPWKSPRYVLSWPRPLPKLANHKLDRAAVGSAVDVAQADDRDAPRRR